MMYFKHIMYSVTVFLVLKALMTGGVSGHCSSPSLSAPEVSSVLSSSHMLVKALVDRVRLDQSALIRIVKVYKGMYADFRPLMSSFR